MTDTNGTRRFVLALIVVVGGGVLFAIHRLTFDQMLAMIGAPMSLYFGQFITAPGNVSVPMQSLVREPEAVPARAVRKR